MKTYFYPDTEWTNEGCDLHFEVSRLLQTVFQEEEAKGYSPREIAHIINMAVFDLEAKQCLSKRLKKR